MSHGNELGLKEFLIAAGVVGGLVGGIYFNPLFTDPEGARVTLDDAQYENVEITGWRAFSACKKGEPLVTEFSATNIRGETVTGVVCGDLFGPGTSIRLDR